MNVSKIRAESALFTGYQHIVESPEHILQLIEAESMFLIICTGLVEFECQIVGCFTS